MGWAALTFEVNPRTGALQVICVEEVKQAVPTEATGYEASRGSSTGMATTSWLRSACLRSSCPPSGRSRNRRISSPWAGTSRRGDRGPHLAGRGRVGTESVPARIPMAGRRAVEEVDTSDLAAALRHPDSRRRFVTIQSDEELTAILDAPLEKWRVFLHPSQERLVAKSFKGPARVTGGAGHGEDGRGDAPGSASGPDALHVPTGQDPLHDLHGDPRPERRAEPRPPLRSRGRTGSRSSTCMPGPLASCAIRAGSSRSPVPPSWTPAGRRRSGQRVNVSSTSASCGRSGSRSSRRMRSRPPPITSRCPGSGGDGH